MKADKLAVDGSFVLLIDSCIALNDDLFVVHRASSTSAGQPRRVTTFCDTVENRFIRKLDRPSRGLILDGEIDRGVSRLACSTVVTVGDVGAYP